MTASLSSQHRTKIFERIYKKSYRYRRLQCPIYHVFQLCVIITEVNLSLFEVILETKKRQWFQFHRKQGHRVYSRNHLSSVSDFIVPQFRQDLANCPSCTNQDSCDRLANAAKVHKSSLYKQSMELFFPFLRCEKFAVNFIV